MATPQSGIFAVGTSAHVFLELDAAPGTDPAGLVAAVAGLEVPHTSLGGTNLVAGFRPELWAGVAPQDAPEGVRGFDRDLVGVEDVVMPATQHDAWVWLAGAGRDVVFDVGWDVLDALAGTAVLADETLGWSYHHSRDLTGFVDGTENPPLSEAPDVALVPAGAPGAGSSVVLVQRWEHLARAWGALAVPEQERTMGRTKADSVELEDLPEASHVARTVLEEDGEELEIFRRNTPYGGITDHGTVFVGFAREQRRLQRMLERMAGVEDGVRDSLTRYTRALTGGYYVVPALDALRRAA